MRHLQSSVSWGAVAPPYWSGGVGGIIQKHGGKSKEIIKGNYNGEIKALSWEGSLNEIAAGV
ncbi:hypothetical protein SESBI_11416 [Sesbania bispinosa]|nr:hypothetical protein SESBI_11416 [Sesbania bispinosa]